MKKLKNLLMAAALALGLLALTAPAAHAQTVTKWAGASALSNSVAWPGLPGLKLVVTALDVTSDAAAGALRAHLGLTPLALASNGVASATNVAIATSALGVLYAGDKVIVQSATNAALVQVLNTNANGVINFQSAIGSAVTAGDTIWKCTNTTTTLGVTTLRLAGPALYGNYPRRPLALEVLGGGTNALINSATAEYK